MSHIRKITDIPLDWGNGFTIEKKKDGFRFYFYDSLINFVYTFFFSISSFRLRHLILLISESDNHGRSAPRQLRQMVGWSALTPFHVQGQPPNTPSWSFCLFPHELLVSDVLCMCQPGEGDNWPHLIPHSLWRRQTNLLILNASLCQWSCDYFKCCFYQCILNWNIMVCQYIIEIQIN